MELSFKKQIFKRTVALCMALLIAMSSMWSGLGVISFATDNIESGRCGDDVTYSLDKTNGELIISGTGPMWLFENSPFSYRDDICTAVICEGVTAIDYGAFTYCRNLTKVYIPASMDVINDSFDGCTNLFDVYYAGSTDGWDALMMQSSTYYIYFLDLAEIHYEHPYTGSNGNVTDGNATDGNVTDGNVTDGNVTDGNITDGNIPLYEIEAGETKHIKIKSNQNTLLKFIPEVSGTYWFYSLSDEDTYGYLFDENKEMLACNDDSPYDLDCNFCVEASLRAGKTYYWGARFYNEGQSGSFDVTLECAEVYCEHKNTEKVAGKDATCTEDGYTEGEKCLDCGGWASGHEIIKGAHKDSNIDRVCDVCGGLAVIKSGNCGYMDIMSMEDYADNAKYNLYLDGTLEIFGEGEIGFEAFWYNNDVKKVIIGEGITSIDAGAFEGCNNITHVTLPESLTTIKNRAFNYCSSLEFIEIPAKVETIGRNAFNCCYELDISIYNPQCLIDSDYYTLNVNMIRGYKGSTAQEYANEHGVYFYDLSRGSVEAVTYTPAKPFEFADKISMVRMTDPESMSDYYAYPVSFSAGDKIEIIFSDERKETYIGVGNRKINFVSENDEYLNFVKLTTDQGVHNVWGVGTHYAVFSCFGKTYTVPVVIKEGPIKSLIATYKYTLYSGYDCEIGNYYHNDAYGDKIGNLNENDFVYEVVYCDDTEKTFTSDEFKAEFGNNIEYSIEIENIGENVGSINIGGISGFFTINIEDGVPGDNLPESICLADGERIIKGKPVEIQLLAFADKGFEHEVTALSVPEGLSVNKDGLLTGTSSGRGPKSITLEVRWKNSPAHEVHNINLYIMDEDELVEIPDEAEEIKFYQNVSVRVPEGSKKWLKFTSPVETLAFRESDYGEVYKKLPNIYTEDGIPIKSFDWGTGGVLYDVKYGGVYYMCVTRDIDFVLKGKKWMPSWTGEGKVDTTELEFVESNVEKTFEGDTNTRWNVYKCIGSVDIDFEGDFIYQYFGMMRRIASPVNIYTESKLISCNQDLVYSESYKYDPNNAEECEKIGASTTQKTLKDELSEDEKEYRFDNVYYFIPKVGTIELTEERTVYIPVGYYIDGVHVVKCTEHANKTEMKENVVDATCTKDGSYTKLVFCPHCDEVISSENVVVPATGHTEVVDKAVAPTCTETGLTEGKHCSVCNEVLVAQETVASLGHAWNDGVIAPDATCTEEGVKTYTCTVCEETRTEAVSAKGHTEAEAVKENEIAATCTEDGSYDTVVYCSACKSELSRETTVVPATGHTEVVDKAVAPTCTETGLTEGKHCSVCNEVIVAQETVAALGHTWDEGVINPDATCNDEGTITYTCTVCAETRTEAVSAKGHTEAEAVTENEIAATCTKAGSYDTVVYCSVCDAELSRETTTVPAKGHNNKTATTKATLSKNGKVETKCTVCGYVSKTTTIYYPKTFSLSAATYTYDGKVKTPKVTIKDSKGKTLVKNTDYTLSSESGRKYPGEYTVTVSFKGNYSGTKKLTFTIKPRVTTKITATQTTTAIKLTWSKVTGATGYRVYKYNTKTKKYEKLKDVKTTSLTISKLKAGTKYRYEVRAYTKDNVTIWGDYSKAFETATKPATPSLKVASSKKGTATLTWTNVAGESGYQIYYSTSKSSGFKKYSSPKANSTKATISKLKSGKTYYFKVRAYTKTASGTVYGDYKTVAVRVK